MLNLDDMKIPLSKSDRKIIKLILKLKNREDAKKLFMKLSPQEKEVFYWDCFLPSPTEALNTSATVDARSCDVLDMYWLM